MLQAGLFAASAPSDPAVILARARATMAEGAALLARRDASPGLSSDPAWLAQHAQVTVALEAEYAQAQAMPTGGVRTCVAEALRLAVEGQQLFQRAFLNDGHGAYYFAAHGNWDLNMAQQRLAGCGT